MPLQTPTTATTRDEMPALLWDVFCRVIDNLGDIGVCWRLCANLARRGQRVRLWIDLPDDLAWMVPGAIEGDVPGIMVLRWTTPLAEGLAELPPADVWIEAFGCDPAPECMEALALRLAAGSAPPVWLNLEYMSAESYVERCHGLPSPVMAGPLKGLTKWFFYPGFTPATGGLLRETDLAPRQAAFDAEGWLSAQGIPVDADGRHRISLFCYEPRPLGELLAGAGSAGQPVDWLITAGRTTEAVAAVRPAGTPASPHARLYHLPRLTQTDFDHLLWSCDLNFVRGEDSLVRALWAGKPFVWHIYPQDDNAHHVKLEAFLDWLEAPPSLREFHRWWNGMPCIRPCWPGWTTVAGWQDCVRQARERLMAQADLVGQLLGFVQKKR